MQGRDNAFCLGYLQEEVLSFEAESLERAPVAFNRLRHFSIRYREVWNPRRERETSRRRPENRFRNSVGIRRAVRNGSRQSGNCRRKPANTSCGFKKPPPANPKLLPANQTASPVILASASANP